jgi:FAD/FMN-containing dehydrogenase
VADGARLSEIVGPENVSDDRTTLDQYAKDMSFVASIRPEYVVRPQNSEQVRALARFANETSTPLVPVSSGPPHFRGDTVPGEGGVVMVDLSGMKKIVRIDRLNRVAMIEPGVTFGELGPQLEAAGLRINMPFLPRREKSVVGSLLARDPVTMPCYQWDIGDPLDCLEVVFGSGDVFRTGSAAGPGSIEEQIAAGGAQDEPLGPGQTSWHRAVQGSQGTLGIVTWATVRCELLPRMEEPFIVGSPRLEKLLEMVHWLVRLRLVNECFLLNDVNLAASHTQKGSGDHSAIKASSPAWMLFFTIAGYDYLPEERVAYQTEDMRRVAQRLGLEPAKRIGAVSAAEVLRATRRPPDEPYWKLRPTGACEDIFFLATSDRLPGLIRTMSSAAQEGRYRASDGGAYLQPVVQGTSFHCEFNLFYDQEDRRDVERTRNLCNEATRRLMEHGAFFSRPHGENARMIANRDAATVSALKKIKAIFDPNNVMNPGKLCF